MGRWLSDNGRWGSPVFIAGESYGGYRVGRLARSLQESAGIGLNGAILISPALEITSLAPTDYDVLGWIDRVPTMAPRRCITGAPARSGRARRWRRCCARRRGVRDCRLRVVPDARRLAVREGADANPRSARGPHRASARPRRPRRRSRRHARTFVRELLRDERKVLGLYDTTITATDPFPDRDGLLVAGPDALRNQPCVHDGA